MPPLKSLARIAVVAAAGCGARFGGEKQFFALAGKTVLWHAVRPFVESGSIDKTRVIVEADAASKAANALATLAEHCDILPVGGQTRAQSVYNGLENCAVDDWAVVHDGARPCLSDDALQRLLAAADAAAAGGVAMALPLADALRHSANERIDGVIKRGGHWLMQTPQCCQVGVLRQALARFADAEDESEALWHSGLSLRLVRGDACNIKITHTDDLRLAEAVLGYSAA